MKLLRKVGATSEIWQVFVRDSSSTTGAGLTGLTNASSGLTAYYHRDTDTTATAISLASMTVGTFTSSGFKEIDATNMPGWYAFCPPNAALASGAKSCAFHLKGATNMAPLPIEVDLDGQADVTHWNGTAVTTPNTAGTPVVDVTRWLGTTVATPGTAGVPDVNVKLGKGKSTVALPLVPTTAGRTLDVSATGEAGLDFDNIKDATGAHTLTNITVPTVTNLTNLPAITAGWLTATGIAADAITAAKVAADVGTEIGTAVWASGTRTLSSLAGLTLDTVTTLTNLPSIPANWLTAAGVAASALNGKGDWLLSSSYTAPDNAGIATIAAKLPANAIADETLVIAATNAIMSRLGAPAGASVSADVAAKPTLAQILAGGDVDGFTLEQTLKLCLAALAGKLSGAATTTVTIRAADDSKARITATVDADGDRSSVTLDAAG